MTRLIFGDRIGKSAKLVVSCAAIIFDEPKRKVLLTRRSDNGLWCLPGGGMDPGESAAECCVRESIEETGLEVRINRLVGVYTSPHLIIEYPDGNRNQSITLIFEAEVSGGTLSITEETTEVGYYTPEQMRTMEGQAPTHESVCDAFAQRSAAFVR